MRLFSAATMWTTLAAGFAFGGQSLMLMPFATDTDIRDPNYPQNRPWRVELQIHDWTFPQPGAPVARIVSLNGLGATAYLFADERLALEDTRDSVSPNQPCFVHLHGLKNALVRLQRDVERKRVVCEVWNYDGTLYDRDTLVIQSTKPWDSEGGTIGGNSKLGLGFLRVFTTLVPPGSRPPTTADAGDWMELKFDQNSKDSSGKKHHASLSTPVYRNTPDQTAVALPKTAGAPFWSPWRSLRAGHPAKLDGTSSYSLADASSSVSYAWKQVSGPSQLTWSEPGSATPTITGLVRGTYVFSLEVTDAAGNKNTAELKAGAVEMDANGVILPSSQAEADFWGPQIAFGYNPWGLADERQYKMVQLQPAYQAKVHDYGWTTTGQGTVSYSWAGKGTMPSTIRCTTVAAPGVSSAESLSIPVADASCLSLESLPTWIMLSPGGYKPQPELVRICSTTATSGPATLTACYDGRGLAGRTPWGGGIINVIPARAWPAGSTVSEFRVEGKGTRFATDSARALCPAGVPGPIGAIAYSSGTVTLTPNSTTVTGRGTKFSADFAGKFIRVAAKHDGGQPFVFWAEIASYSDSSHLSLSRPAPAGVDGTDFAYAITTPMFPVLEFPNPRGMTSRMIADIVGCESETAAFALQTWDSDTMNGVEVRDAKYSYKTSLSELSWVGTTDPNFYGAGLAARNFYYRSGYQPALDLANSIDENWVRDPQVGDGLFAGTPLSWGGGAVGAVADLLFNPSTGLNWGSVEAFADRGDIAGTSCNALDTRDSGYMTALLTLAANYDPNRSAQSRYQNLLDELLIHDHKCKRNTHDGYSGAEVNSFSNAMVWTPTAGVLNLTRGSTAVTGTGFTTGQNGECAGNQTGTISVVNGQSTATLVSGLLSPTDVRIWITDSSGFTGAFEYSFRGKAVQLAGTWTGQTGTFAYMTEDRSLQANLTGIGTGNPDTIGSNKALKKAWACKYVDSEHLILQRPWDGLNGTYKLSHYFIGTFGQQPFMLGIKTNQLRWASRNPHNPSMAKGYAELLPLVGDWYNRYGWTGANSTTLGTFYNTVFQVCADPTVAPAGSFMSIHGQDPASGQPACGYNGLAPGAAAIARVNSAEGGSAMLQFYLAHPTPENRAIVDKFYGAIFGDPLFCRDGVFCDGIWASQLTDADMSGPKWPGFFFGMGGFFVNSWPAVRLAETPR